jgi:hypothetical protein
MRRFLTFTTTALLNEDCELRMYVGAWSGTVQQARAMPAKGVRHKERRRIRNVSETISEAHEE